MTHSPQDHRLQAGMAELLGDAIHHSHTDIVKYSYPAQRPTVPAIKITAQNREGVLIKQAYQSTPEWMLNKECARLLRHSIDEYERPIRAVIGIRVPDRLRNAQRDTIQSALADVNDCSWALWRTDGNIISERFPQDGWLDGSVQELATFIRSVGFYGLRSRGALALIQLAVEEAADALAVSSVIDSIQTILTIQNSKNASRLATVILFDAAVFQYYVSATYQAEQAIVSDPTEMVREGSIGPGNVLAEWEQILKLDYYPIFGLATQILESIDDDEVSTQVLKILYQAVVNAVAGSRNPQGLIGRLFGSLIADSKYLDMPYTSVSLATLMAEAALKRLDVDWGDPEAIRRLRIADFACGTGAMLLATYQRIADRHRTAGGSIDNIHRGMMERSLIGYDIDSTAVHLTAARLAGEQPRLPYEQCRLWALPYGQNTNILGTHVSAGSLEMLAPPPATTIYGDGSIQMGSKGEISGHMEHVPEEALNLVIMNPQVERGDSTQSVDLAVSNRIDTLYKGLDKPLSRSAGNGVTACLIDLAHRKLRPGGVLALVLPSAFLASEDWKNARQMVRANYTNITLLGTADGKALSDDVDIPEVVLVANKRMSDDDTKSSLEHYVALKTSPADSIQAIQLADTELDDDGYLRIGTTVMGFVCDAR